MPSRSWPAILLLAWGMLNLLVESFAMVLPDFIPLQSERYDLVMRRRTLDLPAVRAFLDILQRATIRRKFEVLARYDTTEMGAAIAYGDPRNRLESCRGCSEVRQRPVVCGSAKPKDCRIFTLAGVFK
jgi:hypothetical protein